MGRETPRECNERVTERARMCVERPAAVPDGRVHKGCRHLRGVRGTDRSGVGRAGCRRLPGRLGEVVQVAQ